jgi:hypothetical protein
MPYLRWILASPLSSESCVCFILPIYGPSLKLRWIVERITLRVEGLPQLARLSAGQNNGDRTWSLSLDELEGLLYFPPDP